MDPFILSPHPTRTPTNHLRVLIIDDHEVFRCGLRDLINSTDGFAVVAEGGSCRDALTKVAQIHIDLVILDMYLPDGDGSQIIRQLKKLNNHPLRVVLLSAVMSDETLVDAILAGAEGYLTKDMPADAICTSLKAVQEGQLALPRAVTSKLVSLLVQKFSQREAQPPPHAQNGTPPIDLAPLRAEDGDRATLVPNKAALMLTPQEARVLELLRNGHSNKQIAARLSISHYTVGKHIQNILRKFGVSNRTQAVLYTSSERDISAGG